MLGAIQVRKGLRAASASSAAANSLSSTRLQGEDPMAA